MLQEQSVKFGEGRASICLVLRIPAVSTSHLCRIYVLDGVKRTRIVLPRLRKFADTCGPGIWE